MSAGGSGADTAPADDQVLLDLVTDALLALANVEVGDYSTRLEIDQHTDARLVGLFSGINDMLDALENERRRSREYQRELEEKLVTIEQQRAAIRELSTPILEVWDGVLCLPVIGVIDTVRSSEMTAELLDAIVGNKARYAIVDITGIEVMDTSTADHFIRMARSAQLLGAECALTGINPSIAETMVQMGIGMEGLTTYRNLRDALKAFVIREARRAQGRSRALTTR